jgi:hypothetical protein
MRRNGKTPSKQGIGRDGYRTTFVALQRLPTLGQRVVVSGIAAAGLWDMGEERLKKG